MSHYGPRSGPYDAYSDPTGRIGPGAPRRAGEAGRAGRPYQAGGPRRSQEPPSDPWGGHSEPRWAYDAPQPVADWDRPSEPPPQGPRSNAVLYTAVTVLVIVVAGAVGYALYLLSGEDAASQAAGPGESPAAASPGESVEATASGTPSPEPEQDTTGQAASRAQAGDCVVNNGTEDRPEMQIVACDGEADSPIFEVLARIDEPVDGEDAATQHRSAQDACEGTKGYTHHYFEKSELLNFILCMREQGT